MWFRSQNIIHWNNPEIYREKDHRKIMNIHTRIMKIYMVYFTKNIMTVWQAHPHTWPPYMYCPGTEYTGAVSSFADCAQLMISCEQCCFRFSCAGLTQCNPSVDSTVQGALINRIGNTSIMSNIIVICVVHQLNSPLNHNVSYTRKGHNVFTLQLCRVGCDLARRMPGSHSLAWLGEWQASSLSPSRDHHLSSAWLTSLSCRDTEIT